MADDFNVEVLKLLLQVAWADGEVAEREAQVIKGLGRSWTVDEKTLSFLLTKLEQGHPLPPPNLKFLKTRPDEVMEAARALVAADGRTDAQETELLEQLKAMMDG
jgi:tellurite resistance protein